MKKKKNLKKLQKLKDLLWNEARRPKLSVFTVFPSSSKALAAWGYMRQHISTSPCSKSLWDPLHFHNPSSSLVN